MMMNSLITVSVMDLRSFQDEEISEVQIPRIGQPRMTQACFTKERETPPVTGLLAKSETNNIPKREFMILRATQDDPRPALAVKRSQWQRRRHGYWVLWLIYLLLLAETCTYPPYTRPYTLHLNSQATGKQTRRDSHVMISPLVSIRWSNGRLPLENKIRIHFVSASLSSGLRVLESRGDWTEVGWRSWNSSMISPTTRMNKSLSSTNCCRCPWLLNTSWLMSVSRSSVAKVFFRMTLKPYMCIPSGRILPCLQQSMLVRHKRGVISFSEASNVITTCKSNGLTLWELTEEGLPLVSIDIRFWSSHPLSTSTLIPSRLELILTQRPFGFHGNVPLKSLGCCASFKDSFIKSGGC